MATDITLHVDDEPGSLARIGGALGQAGVNIDGICAVVHGGGKAEVHVLVEDDPSAAFRALEAAELAVIDDQEVVIIAVKDRPGGVGEVAQSLSDAGINLSLVYLATGTRLVLAADDLAAAQAAIG